MRTVLLTTDTPHHIYFAREIAKIEPFVGIIIETRKPPSPSFGTYHPYEDDRKAYEEAQLNPNGDMLGDYGEPVEVESFGVSDGIEVRRFEPDNVIVFGTSHLPPAVFKSRAYTCLNLHGGNPSEYRGLDSHLWAVYHRDFYNLMVSLHHVAPELDTGDIVGNYWHINPPPGAKLAHLRTLATKACVGMVKEALFSGKKWPPAVRQKKLGRYYSHMPAVLKSGCVKKFEEHYAHH